MNIVKLDDNWRIALPMLLTDLVYWLGDEGAETYNISPMLKEQIKYRLNNIIANVGCEQVKELCANDGFNLDDKFFDSLNE